MGRRSLLFVVFAWIKCDAAFAAAEEACEKVKIELYYESQCPGCRDVITRSFKHAYSAPGFLEMAEVTLVPFGNAIESGGDDGASPYSFTCQHGPSECTYNLMETCALAKIGCPYKQFQFVNCVENYDENREPEQDYDVVLNSCAALTGNSGVAGTIRECYRGKEGNELEHQMAAKTGALSPAHTYVPWIVVGGVHDDNVQEKVTDSLLDYVCSTYTGSKKSPGCPDDSSRLRGTGSDLAVNICRTDALAVDDM